MSVAYIRCMQERACLCVCRVPFGAHNSGYTQQQRNELLYIQTRQCSNRYKAFCQAYLQVIINKVVYLQFSVNQCLWVMRRPPARLCPATYAIDLDVLSSQFTKIANGFVFIATTDDCDLVMGRDSALSSRLVVSYRVLCFLIFRTMQNHFLQQKKISVLLSRWIVPWPVIQQ